MTNTSKKWSILKPGDTVQIIAPASKPLDATPESLEEALAQIKNFLTEWGLQTKINKNIFGQDKNFTSFANTDQQRFADLKDALNDSNVKAILCFRGGYGTIRFYRELRKLLPPSQPKLLIGFSDITLLLLYFQQVWGWNVIHGPGALQIVQAKIAPENITRLHDLMFGKISTTVISDLVPINDIAHKQKIIKTSVIGGNLTLISRTFGLPEQIVFKNKILFFEDVGETFRKIDGILQQLQLLKDFSENLPAAIIIGDVSAENPQEQFQIDNCLTDFATQMAAKEIPVLRCLTIGHGKFNQPLPLGPTAILTLGNKPTLNIETGGENIKTQVSVKIK